MMQPFREDLRILIYIPPKRNSCNELNRDRLGNAT
jgi:hypothetical protein